MKNNIVKIAWWGKHFGEEPPLTGNKSQGAGGIFFAGCNLRCVFCQNYQISQRGLAAKEYSSESLADIMLSLQNSGAINVDLVSPTIWARQIKKSVELAKKRGLAIPVVWNSNAFEAEAILKEMDGIADIYLPDFKYGDDQVAFKYSGVRDYSKVAKGAIEEMLHQVGNLKIENGLAQKGVIVRHLVLPGNVENSLKALSIIASIDKKIYLSLLNQYFPAHLAFKFSELKKQVSEKEFKKVFDFAFELGFENGWAQGEKSSQNFLPDFRKKNPFG